MFRFASAWMLPSLLAAAIAAPAQVTTTQVAPGMSHTCVVTAEGGVQCWGLNANGELGNGTTSPSDAPAPVSGLQSGVVSLAVGVSHSCALLQGGGVRCWGSNVQGQMNRIGGAQLVPADIAGLTAGVAAISSGSYHTCALMETGGVKCWGSNSFGEIGDGTKSARRTLTDVTGLAAGVSMIAMGGGHSCAVMATGGAKCWGDNNVGQLGDNSTVDATTPVDVVGLAAIDAIASGESHVCVLVSGAVKCWGYNGLGELGDGTTTNSAVPVDITALGSGVRAIAPGGDHTCALMATGGVKCWGFNIGGEVGDGTNVTRTLPVDVAGLLGPMAAIAVGSDHSCATTPGGTVKCWGFYKPGTAANTPRAVAGLVAGVQVLAGGVGHACALINGGVKCWGTNTNGQLGTGAGPGRLLAGDVPGLTSGVTGLSSGAYHTCALTSAGGVVCWGLNNFGQVGDGTNTRRYTPTAVAGLASGVAKLVAGGGHTCAVMAAGGVKCWGDNNVGQLGNGATIDSNVPVDVVGLAGGIDAIASGESHVCVLVSGAARCWGYNGLGELGDGTLVNRSSPVDIVALGSDVRAIAPGGDHTCALMTGGGVKCWGSNLRGQVGDGTNIQRALPVDVAGLSDVASLTTGSDHSCAATSSGAVKCWGGFVPFPAAIATNTPQAVTGLAGGIEEVSAGFGFTYALTADRAPKAFGANDSGQLADGTTTTAAAAVDSHFGPQSIAFDLAASGFRRSWVDLIATSPSGLGVGFDSWTPDTCTVVGLRVRLDDDGVCGVRAVQPGDAQYGPAPAQVRTIFIFHDRRRAKS